jgi:hypothetical protein
MTIIHLKPGQKFTQTGGETVVGKTGTCADTGIDWKANERHTEHGLSAVGSGAVGTVVASGYSIPSVWRDGLTFDVFIDAKTNQFWYDNDYGF